MPPDKSYDVILLFGPPIQNKSSYIPLSYFRKDFTVICPEKIFRENPALGLRDVTLTVVSALKQKKQVFIEDEFRLKSTRSSILNTLKKKMAQCSVLLLKLLPKYGLSQVCWSHQFSYVQQEKLVGNCEWSLVKQWFDDSQLSISPSSDYVQWPDEKEQFDVQEISLPLQVSSDIKFETPCLFIQWEAALSPSQDFLDDMHSVILKWRSCNPFGNVIFVCDRKNVSKGYVSESDESASVKRHLSDLAEKMKYPVYVLSIKTMSRTSTFCIPPHPGMLAFLQLQHYIDLHSKQTLYIYETNEHMAVAQAAGVRHLKGNKVLANPDIIFKKPAVSLQIPIMLKNLAYKRDEHLDHSFTFPLYDQRDDLVQGSACHLYENGLLLKVFVPDAQTFMSAQESMTQNVLKSQANPSHFSLSPEETQLQTHEHTAKSAMISEDHVLPVWMGKRLRRESTIDSVSSIEEQSSSEQNTSLRCSKTAYIMTEKELHELAVQVLTQAGKINQVDEPGPSTSIDAG